MAKRMRDPAPPGMKTCRRCLQIKSRDEFYADRRNRDGLNGWCKQCVSDASRRRYAGDPERFRNYRRDYLADPANRAKADAISAAWRKRNRADVTRKERARRHANIERTRERGRANAYRARWRRHPAWVEDVERAVVFKRDGGICGICGLPVDPQAFDVDHMVPIAAGGKHCYSNVQVAHPICNREKGRRRL